MIIWLIIDVQLKKHRGIMVRILCLHGWGTSGAILESQSAVLEQTCDEIYDFVFLDGEVPCRPAQGLDEAMDGPFLCYYNSFSPADIANACSWLDAFLLQEGPFDGVLGFSQGGSLALTYLIRHAVERSEDPPPFRFAVLCSSVVAFSPWDTFGQEILDDLTDQDLDVLATFPECDFALLEGKKRIMCESLANVFETAKNGGFIDRNTDGGRFYPGCSYQSLPRVIHPELLAKGNRIRIPTIHVTGAKDDRGMIALSNLLMGVCDPSTTSKLVHPGGHEMPKDWRSAQLLARAIESAVEKSLR